jgi:hypothetical protein
MRSRFNETSARMFATAPLFGLGVGRYFERSGEFMPDELRAFYGNENAHNYFAQQFVEVGALGGILFVWLMASAIRAGAQRLQSGSTNGALLGLVLGTTTYVVTCITGHPLLVPEAALPFGAAIGAVAGAAAPAGRSHVGRAATSVVALALVLAGVETGRGVVAYARAAAPPPERGFHGEEVGRDGERFRWMTRHGVTYIPGGPGFLMLRLRAPDDAVPTRPLVIETLIGGRIADRRELPHGAWTTVEIGVRTDAPGSFRRVDLRANQERMQPVTLGRRVAQRPIAVQVGEIRWRGAEGIR